MEYAIGFGLCLERINEFGEEAVKVFFDFKLLLRLMTKFVTRSVLTSHEPSHEKTCFLPYTNNKGTDQPAHPHSLISTFVVRYLDSIIPIIPISKI